MLVPQTLQLSILLSTFLGARSEYYPARIAKTKPLKTIPETNDILKQVSQINQQADESETTLRLSLDAKARVKLGEFDRGGKTRVKIVHLGRGCLDMPLVGFGCAMEKKHLFILPVAIALYIYLHPWVTHYCLVSKNQNSLSTLYNDKDSLPNYVKLG